MYYKRSPTIVNIAFAILVIISGIVTTGILLSPTVILSVAQINDNRLIETEELGTINQSTQNNTSSAITNTSMPPIQNESEGFCDPQAQMVVECSSLPPFDPYSTQ